MVNIKEENLVLGEAFKYIENWESATVMDMESNGFLDEVSKLHIVGYQMENKEKVNYIFGDERERILKMFKWHEDNKVPVVFHNGCGYDKPAIEKVLQCDLSGVQWIDTLWLSYYLNYNKPKHSIEALAKDYPSVADKFQVDQGDWENLTREQAVLRVVSDVEIGKAIWEDFKVRLTDLYSKGKELIDTNTLVGKRTDDNEVRWVENLKKLTLSQYIGRTIGYITALAEINSIQEATGWQLDEDHLNKHLEDLLIKAESSAKELESVMPKVAKYVSRSEPKLPYKKNGDLSVSGARWEKLKDVLRSQAKDDMGNLLARVRKQGEIEELTSYAAPNINSPDQVKDFLFSHGWVPATFKAVRNKADFQAWLNLRPDEGSPRADWTNWLESRPEERLIPQVKDDGDLCSSVEELAVDNPEIRVLEEYSIVAHRLGVLNGFNKNKDETGRVKASAHGLTSTLRWKHRAPITNLPDIKKLYSTGIRGSLVAGENQVLLGSDLSSLSNR